MPDNIKPTRQQLIQEVFTSMNAMKRGMFNHLHHAAHTLPIPRSQLELLMAIKHMQPVSFKLLAQQLHLSPGAISQLAEALEAAELIKRETDPQDRRIHCLRVTVKGEKLLTDIGKRRQRIMEAVMHDLTDQELEVWVRIHKKLLQQFQNELAKETDKERI